MTLEYKVIQSSDDVFVAISVCKSKKVHFDSLKKWHPRIKGPPRDGRKIKHAETEWYIVEIVSEK